MRYSAGDRHFVFENEEGLPGLEKVAPQGEESITAEKIIAKELFAG